MKKIAHLEIPDSLETDGLFIEAKTAMAIQNYGRAEAIAKVLNEAGCIKRASSIYRAVQSLKYPKDV
jgi:hypothetical protein